jgi:uncharacterized protein
LQKTFGTPVKSDDWWDLLWFLAERTQKGKVTILLDEISWMGSLDPSFLGKLKSVWDTHFKKNEHLILILCGSVSIWIEENILADTGFMGRVSLTLSLNELPLNDCDLFWDKQRHTISPFEKLKILAITGGIPRYLEEVQPQLPAEENIHRLCFDESGILFQEFEQIFSDLFSKRSALYKQIVADLVDGKKDRNTIIEELAFEAGGVISGYLEDLTKAGFIARDFDWKLQDGKISKLSYFRLSDNYLRFYLKYILPNKEKITAGNFKERSLTSLPEWSTIISLQFENLVLSNRAKIKQLLNIRSEDVIADGAYFQRKTTRQPGCQIDYLIQTKFDCLYVCEIKFSKHEIKPDVIDEIKEKITRLKRPRHMSCRPVLIHVNGVHEAIEESGYFAAIIDFGSLLKS